MSLSVGNEEQMTPLLTERVESHPVVNYSQHVFDRLQVVDYLWLYENSEIARKIDGPVDLNDPITLQKHVTQVFQKEDKFYAGSVFFSRPEWSNGVPTHTRAIPINYQPKVIQDGIKWYGELKKSFNQIVDKLGRSWGSWTAVSWLMDRFEERLIELAYGKKIEFPPDYLNPGVLIDFLLGKGEQHLFSISPENVEVVNPDSTTDLAMVAKTIGEKIANNHAIARPLFELAFHAVLLKDFQ